MQMNLSTMEDPKSQLAYSSEMQMNLSTMENPKSQLAYSFENIPERYSEKEKSWTWHVSVCVCHFGFIFFSAETWT